MHIVQIIPVIGAGSGVAGSANQLGAHLRELGHTVESFTADDARGHARKRFRSLFLHRVSRVWYAIDFSIAGTRKAKRFLAERPGAVSICHNAVMTGDLYVNHGVVMAAMRARGDTVWRMLRNPLHTFTFVRDRIRYRGHAHRGIVALTDSEVDVLRDVYGRVAVPVAVIPHGVDLDRFAPPTPDRRAQARAALNLDDEHRVALFIGHELDRKGVPIAIDALVQAPTVLLLIVGGYASAIERMRKRAEAAGVADRVLFVGPRSDLPAYFAASDMFVFPSVYESYGLVITEALASGVPVISAPVGCAPDVIVDGENGYLVERSAAALADAMERIAATDVADWHEACRASVEHRSWRATAQKYVELLARVAPERAGRVDS
ncbi:glycosyltransferase family 4 protein [Microbacterium esteraromaticum]|uniref:glycosyltransferase family 4 protein n=1 Tax=Microbacterium esteraromaticum TaxID=57043 RepID=UPI001C968C4A|nr:glycosyltransferase family 4 protein [Microbacterium esteraromaticum]MBY6060283.1 glycosyltransferase family 4 protein [Microbacterium esteraromaticum]